MQRLLGKVALVTGGARGQGAAHVRAFAREGATVIVADVLDAEGGALAGSLAAEGLPVSYLHLDVSSESDWWAASAYIVDGIGSLTTLVNNAGIIGSAQGATHENLADWSTVIAVNMTGVFLGIKYCVPLMGVGGSIVNTSSVWGIVGGRDYIAYQASKGAVLQMTRAAAVTYASQGIRTNSISPGQIDTPMNEDDSAEVTESMIAATPLARIGLPEEIAAAAVFLASDESSFMTGANLVIDGGYSAQ